jgi:hypothetical protein
MQTKRTESSSIQNSVLKSGLIKLSNIWGSVQAASVHFLYLFTFLLSVSLADTRIPLSFLDGW